MIWVILTLVFIVLRVAPGDPVSAALGDRLNAEALDQRREALGYNDPILLQYWDYLTSVARLDFGTTFSDNQDVLEYLLFLAGPEACVEGVQAQKRKVRQIWRRLEA